MHLFWRLVTATAFLTAAPLLPLQVQSHGPASADHNVTVIYKVQPPSGSIALPQKTEGKVPDKSANGLTRQNGVVRSQWI